MARTVVSHLHVRKCLKARIHMKKLFLWHPLGLDNPGPMNVMLHRYEGFDDRDKFEAAICLLQTAMKVSYVKTEEEGASLASSTRHQLLLTSKIPG